MLMPVMLEDELTVGFATRRQMRVPPCRSRTKRTHQTPVPKPQPEYVHSRIIFMSTIVTY